VNYGVIQSNGTSEISGLSSIVNAGTIELQSGSLKLDAGISGTGALAIGAGATLELSFGVSSGQTLTFEESTGTLKLDNAPSFQGVISGFTGNGQLSGSDQIDLADININSGHFTESFISSTDVLTVSDGTNTANLQFNGTYVAGNFSFVSDGGDGTIVYDPPLSSGPLAGATLFTIASGSTVELANPVASGEDVTFHSSTGVLILDNPSSFAGLISGFAGDGTLAGSDQIDLKGINYHSSTFSESYNSTADTLTVSDGINEAMLHFVGNYQSENFSFASDGDDGTIVYDPPVPSGPGVLTANTPVAGKTASDGFAFRPDLGQSMTANFNAMSHGTKFDYVPLSEELASLQSAKPGFEGLVVGGSHGPIFENPMANHLSTHDFHIV
jgi:hypothetical protein